MLHVDGFNKDTFEVAATSGNSINTPTIDTSWGWLNFECRV